MKTPQNVSGERTLHRSSSPFFTGQKEASSFFQPLIQAKLAINGPHDQYEQEADQMADQAMTMEKASPVSTITPVVQRAEEDDAESAPDELVSDLSSSKGSGSFLPEKTRGSMEQFFSKDFSQVKVHTGGDAVQMNRDIQAKAFTHGNDIYFNEGQYAPESDTGKHLLAHELTHTVQQNGGGAPAIQRYTDEEIRRMAEFRERGQQSDIDMANARGFTAGDIVFRSGSTALGFLTGLPVTHGGIYIGGGLIHDVVGFGNRFVRVTNFFSTTESEAADATTFRLIRFVGPLSALIIARLLSNIGRRDFRMPTDPVPFNLFSSSDDYGTATCLEYAHAQFLYAIRQLSTDPTTSATDVATLRATYFTGAAAEPDNLISPQVQSLMGDMPTGSSSFGGPSGFGGGPSRSPSARTQEMALIAAASIAARNVDSARFSNRSESSYEMIWPGGPGVGGTLLNLLMGHSHDRVTLNTFTYQSFVDSTRFFQEMTLPPRSPGVGAPAAHGR
ncbi:DUF4157 domain-containing protein [Chitinophaga sp. SYP-B3965]|uniref:eCIS core domain-containing protein n=1 Tax=Chitinophaga sp. SYP-B3965 TaxID=2663120 RepID=UPI001299FEFC|nr:DUF4157 domain-containing protein [Chitinophaga sp. SYP-B3965]MRG48428.1 DUF4157 domain-containing protein [Chitinophaga sp. SYP-B3965]